MTKKQVSEKFSFKGWNLIGFLKGRKKLVITLIGACSTYAITQNVALAGIIGAVTELSYAVVEYYIKD
jgi:hypothetical protein